MNEEIVDEMNSDEFEYFLANDQIVAGVTKEDADKVYFIVIKSDNYSQGMAGELDKDILDEELKQGLTLKLESFEEAEEFDMKQHAEDIA